MNICYLTAVLKTKKTAFLTNRMENNGTFILSVSGWGNSVTWPRFLKYFTHLSFIKQGLSFRNMVEKTLLKHEND